MIERDPNLEEEFRIVRLILHGIIILLVIIICFLTMIFTSCAAPKKCDAYGNGKVYFNSK
jgi:hypothetical protein